MTDNILLKMMNGSLWDVTPARLKLLDAQMIEINMKFNEIHLHLATLHGQGFVWSSKESTECGLARRIEDLENRVKTIESKLTGLVDILTK